MSWFGPLRLWGSWYLVKDTSRPCDYPPRARDELVRRRLSGYDLGIELDRLRREVHGAPMAHPEPTGGESA